MELKTGEECWGGTSHRVSGGTTCGGDCFRLVVCLAVLRS